MHEKKRKIFHIAALTFPILYYFFLSTQQMLLLLSILTLLISSIDIARMRIPFIQEIITKIFKSIIKPHEHLGLSGMSYMFTSFLITTYFFPKELAILSWLILIICDPVAALCGKKYGQPNKYGKSLAGSQAFLVTAFLICLVGTAYFGLSMGFAQVLFAIFCTAAAEFFSNALKIDDNLLIPIVFCMAAGV